jgi:hypothetical protein
MDIKEQEQLDREAQTLTKANEAIAIRPKRGKLTLLSRRIYNALLYHAQQQGVDNATYKIPLVDLINDSRFSSNNTELLKSHLRDMQATTIEWSTSSAAGKKWESTQLIGTITIEERGSGHACFITWRYPEEIKERLVKPSQYTKILLEIGAQMRSYSASVLYELGARYLTSPGRLTMREDVLWWASVLTGRSDIKDVDYRFLKRDVIGKALIEVDTLSTEFSLELIEHKHGRKVEELQFRVIQKSQQALGGMNDPARNVFNLEIVGRLIALGLRQSDAQDTYATTDEGQISSALDVVEQRLKNKTLPELKSPTAYFRDALKRGYTLAKLDFKAEGQGEVPKALAAPPVSPEGQLQKVRDAWHAKQLQKAREMFNEMNEVQKSQAKLDFESTKLNTLASPIIKAWKKDAEQSKIAASSFFRWLAETTWRDEVSDQELVNFAMQSGILKL